MHAAELWQPAGVYWRVRTSCVTSADGDHVSVEGLEAEPDGIWRGHPLVSLVGRPLGSLHLRALRECTILGSFAGSGRLAAGCAESVPAPVGQPELNPPAKPARGCMAWVITTSWRRGPAEPPGACSMAVGRDLVVGHAQQCQCVHPGVVHGVIAAGWIADLANRGRVVHRAGTHQGQDNAGW